MHTTGTHNWVIVVIRSTPHSEATHSEQQLNADFPDSLNDWKIQRKPYMRWLVRCAFHKQLTEAVLNDHNPWQQYVTA